MRSEPYSRRMRWTIVAACAAVLGLAGAGLATASLKPVLRLGTGTAVRGSHFKAHEVVHVVFTSDVRNVRVIRASGAGSFAARLPAYDSCSGLSVRATGTSGDVATIALSKGLCPPPSASGGQAQSSGSSSQSGESAPPSTSNSSPDPHGPATVNPTG